MSVKKFILFGISTALIGAIFVALFQVNDGQAVQDKIEQLVQAYDDAIYLASDYEAAKIAATEIASLAGESKDPKATEVRGLVRLAYAEIAVDKWENRWEKKLERCEDLVPKEPTVARAEFLLYSGIIKGKYQLEFAEGVKRVESAVHISDDIKDDRTLSIAYANLGELQNFLGQRNYIAANSYRALTIAEHYGQNSILLKALQCLKNELIYRGHLSEAAECSKEILEIDPENQDGLFILFMAGESDRYPQLVDGLLENVEEKQANKSATKADLAAIGLALRKTGLAFAVREKLSASKKYTDLAIPYLQAVGDKSSLQGCLELSKIFKLEDAKTASEVDKIKNTLALSDISMIALANAYAKVGESEKSAAWRLRLSKSERRSSRELEFLKNSSDLFWESKVNSRRAELSGKQTTESQRRVWILGTALAMGLTVCALLGGFYMLLRRERNTLDDLVKKKTKSLSTAMEAASGADRAKSEFLAQINHEIRNPLTAILGYCDLLSLTTDKPHEFVAGIESSSTHLRELVDKILEVSKIESNGLELNFTEFLPAQTVSGINDIMAEQAAQKELEFDCSFCGDATLTIHSDETKIRQVALNLIGNAIKFTSTGRVAVSFKLIKDDSLLVIVVEDTGIGIAKAETQAVFDRFSKASNGVACDGSGLGLFITSRLVNCLEGEISLASELGIGTEVTVRLPVKFACDQRAIANSEADHDTIVADNTSVNQGKRVVIVDDQEVIRTSLRLLLNAHGMKCKTAENLEQTMELITNWQPDLVLLDLRMPEHSGYEVFKRIRLSASSSVPIYAMTGDATAQIQVKCSSVGFDGFIIKPFEISTIEEILNAQTQAV